MPLSRFNQAMQRTRWPGVMIRFDFYGLAARVADSSSTKAVSFSSARTTKRFPSSRCASAKKLILPLESTASDGD
jgi:hypothetical protein